MKKFEGILLCTDLDGTLLRNDKTISEENLHAIEYFKQEGGLFTFVTGRPPMIVRDIYETVQPNAPFGCNNGGGLYDPCTQSYIWAQGLPHDVLELVSYADERIEGLGIQVNSFHHVYFCKENSAMEYFRKVTGVPNVTCRLSEVTEPIAKILFGDEREETLQYLKEILDAHPRAQEFDFIRSEKKLYEILPKGIGKGTAIQKLVEILQIDANKTIAVGDYNNDISMLRTAKLGIAVANACSEAKAAADHVTVSNEEHAIAQIIADLNNGRLSI